MLLTNSACVNILELMSGKQTIFSGQLFCAYDQSSSCVEWKKCLVKTTSYIHVPVLLCDVLNSTFTGNMWMLFRWHASTCTCTCNYSSGLVVLRF